MPIFEYTCLDCGKDFETIVFKSSEKVCCPACKTEHIEKKLSKFAFKGSERFVGTGGSSGCSSCSSGSCSSCH